MVTRGREKVKWKRRKRNMIRLCAFADEADSKIEGQIAALKENGVWTYALELGGGDIYKSDLKGKVALVVGGEDTGVNQLTLKKCDGVVTIPLCGKVNSLNASVATGIGVFEVVRQRRNG